jgi:hypothetical protein
MAGSAGNFSYTFSAGETQVITVDAEFISCIAATGEFEIVADDVNRMFMKAGISYINRPGNTYNRLRITNKLGSANAITIQFGPGELRDQRLTVSGSVNVVTGPGVTLDVATPVGAPLETEVSGDVNVVTAPGDILATGPRGGDELASGSSVLAAASAATLMGANANRMEATFENVGTGEVYLKDSGGASAEGVKVAPGERVTLRTGAAVVGYNPNAWDVTLITMQTRWA